MSGLELFPVASRPPGTEPRAPPLGAVPLAVPPAPAPTLREEDFLATGDRLKLKLHSPRELELARHASVRPNELAPVPPAQGSIVRLPSSRPKTAAPSPPPVPAGPSASTVALFSSSEPPLVSPRRKRQQERSTGSGSGPPQQQQQMVRSVTSPRTPRVRSPRVRSPRSSLPRSHRQSTRSKSPPSSPRLEPNEYREALRQLRVELRELSERHELEVEQVRTERDELRARLGRVERLAARYRQRLRALGALDDALEVDAALPEPKAGKGKTPPRSPQRHSSKSKATPARVDRGPTYHVSTSSSSAEQQILALQKQRKPPVLSSSSADGSDERPAAPVPRPSQRPAKRLSSSSSSSGPPVAEVLASANRRGSDSSSSVVVHRPASAALTPAKHQMGTSSSRGGGDASTLGSVQLFGADEVVHVGDSGDDSFGTQVHIVNPTVVEIVEARPHIVVADED